MIKLKIQSAKAKSKSPNLKKQQGRSRQRESNLQALARAKQNEDDSDEITEQPALARKSNAKEFKGFTAKKFVPKHKVKQFIEFKSIKKGSFFASRVLIDEAIIKNYIKANKSRILKWIREPHQLQIQSIIK